jgi:hypothetical protein
MPNLYVFFRVEPNCHATQNLMPCFKEPTSALAKRGAVARVIFQQGLTDCVFVLKVGGTQFSNCDEILVGKSTLCT